MQRYNISTVPQNDYHILHKRASTHTTMPLIEMMSHTGVAMVTPDQVGSEQERKYFRVIVEDVGKLFFSDEGEYRHWVDCGRPFRGVVENGRPVRRSGRRSATTATAANAEEGGDEAE